MNACRIDFDETECVFFNERSLEKYNEIWKKVSNIIKKII